MIAALVLVAVCGQTPEPGQPTAAPVAVEIPQFRFQLEDLEVPTGTVVTWTNQDAIEHSITSGGPPTGDGTFDSGFFVQADTFTFTFGEPGDYTYFCRRHNGMTGIVRVKP